jgi:hypothetical protein
LARGFLAWHIGVSQGQARAICIDSDIVRFLRPLEIQERLRKVIATLQTERRLLSVEFNGGARIVFGAGPILQL